MNSKKIKICFIAPKTYSLFNPQLQTHFGGANVDLYYLSTELAKDPNFDVSFITADYGQPEKENLQNVRLIKSLNLNGNALIGIFRIWKALKKADAKIYMFKTATPGTFLVALFCKLKKRAFVYRTAHKRECFGDYIKEHLIWGKAFKWALKNAKIVFVQNEADKNGVKQTIGIESTALPNGHRIEPLQEKNCDTILWVGRSVHFKHAEKFLELAKAFPDEHFTIICQKATGDNTYNDLVTQANSMDNLEFIKTIPFHEIQSYFQKAKVFVNTSDAEGFPNTFIQACMAAAPILSLNVNPDNFLYEYNCGLCCNGDFNKLTLSLADMLKDDKYKQMGENARKYVKQKHDISNIIEQYKNLFIEISK